MLGLLFVYPTEPCYLAVLGKDTFIGEEHFFFNNLIPSLEDAVSKYCIDTIIINGNIDYISKAKQIINNKAQFDDVNVKGVLDEVTD